VGRFWPVSDGRLDGRRRESAKGPSAILDCIDDNPSPSALRHRLPIRQDWLVGLQPASQLLARLFLALLLVCLRTAAQA
jgi:hypothetical protein